MYQSKSRNNQSPLHLRDNIGGATTGETMPETFEKAPNNHPGVQSRICLPTPP
jgi:hypothetical protein